LGDIYRRTNQPQLAVAHFRDAASLAPADASIRVHLGLAYVEAGETDPAIEAFREAVRLRPDDADANYNLGVVIGEKIRTLVDEKVQVYRRTVELRPALADAHYYLGVAYIQKAQISRVDEKRALLQLALEEFRRFEQSAPQDPKAPTATHNIEVLEPQVK
jgi:Flp pilus assembly protein TadD